jgi:hypothetical protein
MENENNAVELNLESFQDDAELAQGESLSTLVDETATQQNDQNNETPPAKEPGWIKGRINKAVEKAVAETEARLTKHYEEMLAPIRASVMERQAQELVDSGEFKSIEMAKEYIALKNGVPYSPAQPEQQKQEPARDSQGRFAPHEQNNEPVDQRADFLAKQANKIKSRYGIDVMETFNSDSEVKGKILSGEWDFYDVLEEMNNERKPTAPVRSSNGGVSQVDIFEMSDAQWKKLNENLSMGRRYDMRK